MKGNPKPILKYLEGSDKRFVIPVYQRNYDWKKDNCQQLLDDLVDVIRESRPSHFFGSIVSSTEGDDYIIIDGQQRITTVSLLLLALMNRIEEGTIAVENPLLAQKIREDYLIDKWQPTERKFKLKPVKSDMLAFNRLFLSPDDYVLESNITQNYLFFYEKLPLMGVGADELFSAIKKLEVIDITLEPGDDPQLIFESLNSTGLDLSEADKIRNFVLMRQPQKQQEYLYEQYWNKIEVATDFWVSDFIRRYLTFKLARWPRVDEVYQEFKAFALPYVGNIEELLKELLKFARYFRLLGYADSEHYEINSVLKRLARLDRNVSHPFLFAVLERFYDGKLSPSETREVLVAIESFLLRRIICEVPTNALNKIFARLNYEVEKAIEDDSDYVPALIYILESKSYSGRFPSNEEFRERVLTRDFYAMRPSSRVYIFDRLESGDSYEKLDIASMMEARDHKLTIEHIMPQTLTEGWKQELGPDFEEIHATWLNRIANLTLTAYNSTYSNRLFSEKLEMEDGFKQSPLPLNKWIAQQDTWGLAQLEERAQILADRFIELWPYPSTTWSPKETTGNEYSLDDDINFTGTVPLSFTFLGTKHNANSWKAIAAEVLSEINEMDSVSFRMIATRETNPNAYLSVGSKDRGWVKVGQDIFAYLATSTDSKLSLLQAIFEEFGLEGDDLIIELRPDAQDVEDEEQDV